MGSIKGPPHQQFCSKGCPPFSAKDEKTVTQSKAELFMYYKDKADKQTSVSLGKKKQFHKCRKDPIATFPQDPPPALLDLRRGLQVRKANDTVNTV